MIGFGQLDNDPSRIQEPQADRKQSEFFISLSFDKYSRQRQSPKEGRGHTRTVGRNEAGKSKLRSEVKKQMVWTSVNETDCRKWESGEETNWLGGAQTGSYPDKGLVEAKLTVIKETDTQVGALK